MMHRALFLGRTDCPVAAKYSARAIPGQIPSQLRIDKADRSQEQKVDAGSHCFLKLRLANPSI